jgi:hypothetical protein
MNDKEAKHSLDVDDMPPDTPESYLSPHTHAFVVKIWLESLEAEGDRSLWRGHITHVNTRQQRYFQDLPLILEFIQSCLNRGFSPLNPRNK